MNIEIHKPELERRVRAHIQSGHFHDTDELLTQAFDALDEKAIPPEERAGQPNDQRTGAGLILALQASPHRELDIEPARYRLPVRDVHF
jgi:hypothetical protein